MSVALVMVGCGTETAETSWVADVEVVADTTIVTTLSGQTWTSAVMLREERTIGALDGPAELTFGEVSKLAEDRDGGIYVLDGQVPEIRHFDRHGQYVRTVGREGRGPGEYSHLTLGMVVDSDRVLHVYDWGNLRVARFGPDGQSLDPWPVDTGFRTTRPGPWVFNDVPGRVFLAARTEGGPALVVVENGQVSDTVVVPVLPGVPASRGGPYDIAAYWSRSPDGRIVVGTSGRYLLEVHGPEGVLRVRREVEPEPVHPAEADAWVRHFEWMEQHPSYRPPEGEWIPSAMPPFSDIDVGSDGRIWVRRSTTPIPRAIEETPDAPPPVPWIQPFLYDVFEPDGTYLGEIRFPDTFEPHLFGEGVVWGVRRGEWDEQYVVLMRLDYPSTWQRPSR